MIVLRFIWIGIFFCSASFTHATDANIKSPDGQILFNLFTNDQALFFNVAFMNIPVVANSPVIFSINDLTVTQNVKIKAIKNYQVNESYAIWGNHSMAINHYNGMLVSIESNQQFYQLDIRVFNDGAAFRLLIPGNANDKHIPDETTIFNL